MHFPVNIKAPQIVDLELAYDGTSIHFTVRHLGNHREVDLQESAMGIPLQVVHGIHHDK